MSAFEDMKHLRTGMGITQGELARKVGVDRSSVAKFEKGVKSLTEDKIRELAEVLGINFDSFKNKSVPLFKSSKLYSFRLKSAFDILGILFNVKLLDLPSHAVMSIVISHTKIVKYLFVINSKLKVQEIILQDAHNSFYVFEADFNFKFETLMVSFFNLAYYTRQEREFNARLTFDDNFTEKKDYDGISNAFSDLFKPITLDSGESMLISLCRNPHVSSKQISHFISLLKR